MNSFEFFVTALLKIKRCTVSLQLFKIRLKYKNKIKLAFKLIYLYHFRLNFYATLFNVKFSKQSTNKKHVNRMQLSLEINLLSAVTNID